MARLNEIIDELARRIVEKAIPLYLLSSFLILTLAIIGYSHWALSLSTIFLWPIFCAWVIGIVSDDLPRRMQLGLLALTIGCVAAISLLLGTSFIAASGGDVLRSAAPVAAFVLGSILTSYRSYAAKRGWEIRREFNSSLPWLIGVPLTFGSLVLAAYYLSWPHLAVTAVGGVGVSHLAMNIFRSWSQLAILLGPAVLLLSYFALHFHPH
jgi:hypothetical protein